MKDQDLKKETATQKYHREMAEIKPKLPDDWRIQFLKMHPEYDSYKGGVLVSNCMNGKSTDTVILEAFKKIVEQYKNKGS